ncbi:competence protein ComK [Bacillus sp. 31A1R]|uniref:Competence protein ComK n=1 Tax=Robertmurraya mangrovi TaxID=3098077 RepID=A0ABU5IW46_9BACI|nr:competence protein ComK [Bacillus sp. 31A1R]MDZ5471368.1 competence protein ComK [Bacillus sp. 31A1R]
MNTFGGVLTKNTMAVSSRYDQCGNLTSLVFDKKGKHKVDKSSKKLIEDTLLFFAESFEGAVKGAKSVIGRHHMPPIVICAALNMYWFPTHSPDNDECTWFSLAHIARVIPLDAQHCKVIFKNGESILVNMKSTRLEAKRNLAAKLKTIVDDRCHIKRTFLFLPDSGMMCVSDNNDPYMTSEEENHHKG